MATKTETRVLGEWLKIDHDHPEYCIESRTIKQVSGATAGLASGNFLENSGGKLVVTATGASTLGILLEPVGLDDLRAGDTKRPVLVRGPARYDSSYVTCASAEKANGITALAVLEIRVDANSTSATWTTQST